jgi:prephenate dehydrogenase
MAVAGEGTVVSDCASVKTEVSEWAKAGKLARFVPGHPMAGHEKGGATYASAWMFRSARWILTPVKATATASVRTIEALVKAMGATPIRIDAAEHDRHVATVSHLPHVLAALLVNLGDKLESADIAGGSWRDMTRVGGVDPELWTQIMVRNRAELARILREYEGNLALMRQALEDDDRNAVREILVQAQRIKASQTPPDVTRVAKRGRR